MFYLTFVFFVFAIIAAIFGFTPNYGGASLVAKSLFLSFSMMSALSFIGGMVQRTAPRS